MAVDALARAIAAGKVPVTAYEMAVKAGYTGTEEQFAQDMGNSGTNAANAAASASAAAASAESISASAAQIATNTSDISDLKESINECYQGNYNASLLGFTVGSLYTSGKFNPNIKNRVSTEEIVSAPVDLYIVPSVGFRAYYYYFNNDGTKTFASGWMETPFTIPSNTPFTMVLARTEEVSGETADVTLFVSKMQFAVPFEKQILDLKAEVENGNTYIDKRISTVFDGNYVPRMEETSGVALNTTSVGDVVDLSGLSAGGRHRTVLIRDLSQGECIYINVIDGDVSRPWAFMDEDYKLISKADDAYATDTELIVPDNAVFLLVQCGNIHFANAKVIRYASFTEYNKSVDINIQNDYTDMILKLENASNSAKEDTNTPVKNRASLLNLIHFSDIHGSVDNIKRLLRFADLYNDYISGIIHTGDSVTTYFGQDNPFATTGGDRIMNVVGNHDCWIQGDAWPSPYNATAQQVYEKFFAPFISNWNVVSPGENLCYYYKDYTTANVRLIVLDALHYDSVQETWFAGVLADAITNELRVVAITHYPAQTGITGFECTFNSITQTIDAVATPAAGTQIERLPESAFTAVDTFINNGGEFVCWLSGHTHDDFIGVVNNHTNQIQVIVSTGGTSNRYSDCARTKNTKTADLFNVFTVDGNAKLIKLIRVGSTMDKFMRKRETLCVNYATRQVVSNN